MGAWGKAPDIFQHSGALPSAPGMNYSCSFCALQTSTSTTMNDKHQASYKRLCTHAREVAILNSMQGLLGWDERTKLPPAGGEYRAEQMSFLAGLIHKKQTAPEVGEWLAELIDSPLAADRFSQAGADIVNLK